MSVIPLMEHKGTSSDEDTSKTEGEIPFSLNMMFQAGGTRMRVRPRIEEKFRIEQDATTYKTNALIKVDKQTGFDGNIISIIDGDPTKRIIFGSIQYIRPDGVQNDAGWIKTDGTVVAWE